tara:strand:+ start:436 stop:819 length:384 start_codon:yes stop_codon:yes gene_type:complete
MDEVELRSVICHLAVMAMEVEDPQMLYDEVVNPPVVYTPRTSELAEEFADSLLGVAKNPAFWTERGLAGGWVIDELVSKYRAHHGLDNKDDAPRWRWDEDPIPKERLIVMVTANRIMLTLINPDWLP